MSNAEHLPCKVHNKIVEKFAALRKSVRIIIDEEN